MYKHSLIFFQNQDGTTDLLILLTNVNELYSDNDVLERYAKFGGFDKSKLIIKSFYTKTLDFKEISIKRTPLDTMGINRV